MQELVAKCQYAGCDNVAVGRYKTVHLFGGGRIEYLCAKHNHHPSQPAEMTYPEA